MTKNTWHSRHNRRAATTGTNMSAAAVSIQKLYVAYFSRPADIAGLIYWEGVMAEAKSSTAAVSATFATSAEYKAIATSMLAAGGTVKLGVGFDRV